MTKIQNIEDEKKLVATELGLSEVVMIRGEHRHYRKGGASWSPKLWKPESERKWWDEIWEKMDDDLKDKYIRELDRLILEGMKGTHEYLTTWDSHTAKPETCWKALIKTLT